MTTPAPALSRCRLLVVDDEQAILSLLDDQLRQEFQIHLACSCEEAQAAFQAHPIDIVLTDLGLGSTSGIHLLDWAQQHYPNTSRVLMSGTARLEDAADAINHARIHRLVLKPWRSEDLLAHLKEVARLLLLERNHARLREEMRQLNQNLERRVNERTRELQKMNHILERMALTDTLTGLPNRGSIDMVARQELLRRTRVPAPIAFGIIDADHFKNINTAYLHSGGDYVLASLAQVFQHTVRGTDAIGRVGGEEFLVVAPDTDAPGAEALAERLRAATEDMVLKYEGAEIRVTISLGFAVADANTSVEFEKIRTLAELALSQAKKDGRNRAVILRYEPEGSQLLTAAS